MAKTRIVFYSICHKATRFRSEEQAAAAAEEYGKEHGYACETFLCNAPHVKEVKVSDDGELIEVYSGGCWHVRPKTYPPETREQWEQRVAEKRRIEELEAALNEAIRLQRAAEQEVARAEAVERKAEMLAAAPKTPKVRHKAVSGKRERRRKYNDGLTTRQRWEKEGRCIRCGKAKQREDRKNCDACRKLTAEYQRALKLERRTRVTFA